MKRFLHLRLFGQVAAGLGVVLFTIAVISAQINDRRSFASGALHRDVIERWGAPISQAVPSVRAVESGSVFKALESLPFDRQQIVVDAAMNYRKRGLVYFSGFDFRFAATYSVSNPRRQPIDVVFVFPVDLAANRVLLSDLEFRVDGEPSPIDLAGSAGTLLWTGRLEPGAALDFDIGFAGRGLDSFVYHLDPELPVRGFALDLNISGGDNFDYPTGVVPAAAPEANDDGVVLRWRFDSLESGVPIGAILPSEKSFDALISRMIVRSWAPFILFLAGLQLIGLSGGRTLAWHEALLLAAGYAFFSVLLPYLSAYLHFYLAYPISLAVVGTVLAVYSLRLFGDTLRRPVVLVLTASLVVPTFAVVLEGHTGLVYTLEILALLAGVMWLTTRPIGRRLLAMLTSTRENQHAV